MNTPATASPLVTEAACASVTLPGWPATFYLYRGADDWFWWSYRAEWIVGPVAGRIVGTEAALEACFAALLAWTTRHDAPVIEAEYQVRKAAEAVCDALWSRGDETPLRPLGDSTDAYTFPNGVIVYWHQGNAHIHAGAGEQPVKVPLKAWPVIVATCKAMGLDDTTANLVAEAAEAVRS